MKPRATRIGSKCVGCLGYRGVFGVSSSLLGCFLFVVIRERLYLTLFRQHQAAEMTVFYWFYFPSTDGRIKFTYHNINSMA